MDLDGKAHDDCWGAKKENGIQEGKILGTFILWTTRHSQEQKTNRVGS